MKKYIHFILFALFTGNVIGQTLPSPASMGVVKNGNQPVSLFTGTTSMNVPLYTATNSAGSGVPVMLQYHAGGIKVNEIAGPVGLSWNLLAGGSITRVIRGVPDEYASMVDDPRTITGEKLNRIIDGTTDSEKDLIYFSIPGASGKLIFSGNVHEYVKDQSATCTGFNSCAHYCGAVCLNHSDEQCEFNCLSECRESGYPEFECTGDPLVWTAFQTMPYSDLEFRYVFGDYAQSSWKIVDPKSGVTYHFDKREVTTSSTRKPGEAAFGEKYTYESTWHLSKIDYPDGDNITFTYTDAIDEEITTREYHTFATFVNAGSNRDLNVQGIEETRNKTITGTRYLAGIHFAQGSIDFAYQPREDLTAGKRLSQVYLRDKSGNTVSTTVLHQSYFSSGKSFKTGGVINGCSDAAECKRLKLEAVYQDGGLVQSYTYRNEQGYDGSGINYYELPPRDSYYFDHYGYHNAGGTKGNNYAPYPMLSNVSVQEDGPEVHYNLWSGVDRDSYQDYALANILTRIDYPGGGHTKYTYQVYQGKIRTQAIERFDEHDLRIFGNSYIYERATSLPIYQYHLKHNGDKFRISQRSSTNMLSLNGPDFGYGKVTVKDLMGQGSSEHFFYTNLRKSEITPYKHRYSVKNNNTFSDLGDGVITDAFEKPPFSISSLKYYDWGVADKVQTYNADGTLLSEKVFNYDAHDESALYSVTNLRVEVTDEHANDKEVYVSRYDMEVRPYRWLSTTETYFDEEGNENATTTQIYPANGYITIPTEVHTVKSDGYESRTFMQYLGLVGGKKMYGMPQQTEVKIKLPEYHSNDFRTVSVNKTDFKVMHGLVVPYTVKSLTTDSPLTIDWTEDDLELVHTFIDYNERGQVLKQQGSDGIIQEFTYDDNGFLASTILLPNEEADKRTTTYDHQLLVGMEKVTDPNDRSMTYGYDSRNRLHLVRDQDEDVVERYRYDYGQEDNGLHAEIKISGDRVLGRTLTFSAINPRGYGAQMTEYQWDFDGVSKSGPSVTHSFSSAGRKTIRLNILNSEYDAPLQVTSSIDICDPPEYALRGPESGCTFDDGTEPPHVVEYAFSLSNSGAPYTATVTWQYRQPDAAWYTFDRITSDEAAILSNRNFLEEGAYQIKAIISGCNGKTLTKSLEITHCSGNNNNDSGGNDDESNDDSEEETCTTPVSISPSSWKVEPSGDSKDFVVSSSSFRVSDNQPWISTGVSGTTLTVEVDKHPGGALRPGKVTIRKGYCTASIFISQEGPSETCADGCHWDPVDGRCEDENGDPEKCNF